MVGALFDTNILIDYLNGNPAAKVVLAQHERKAISLITFMEVLVGVSKNEEDAILPWLQSFDIIAPNMAIAMLAVEIRQQKRIKLPDAIILATARFHSLTLVSRNTKDFPEGEADVLVPY